MIEPRLPEPLRKCLAVVLDNELNGKPLPFEQYRARNPKKIPLLDALELAQAMLVGFIAVQLSRDLA